jgi:hypothetical protein
LGKKPIPFYELDLANEWIEIRSNLTGCSQIPFSKSFSTCNQETDRVFYYRHPELEGQLLDGHNKNLAQEWKQIRNKIPGCYQ